MKKATLQVLTIKKDFSLDQDAIMKRIARVLEAHDLQVKWIVKKDKSSKPRSKLKVVS